MKIIARESSRRRLEADPVKASRLPWDLFCSSFLAGSSMTLLTSDASFLFFKPPFSAYTITFIPYSILKWAESVRINRYNFVRRKSECLEPVQVPNLKAQKLQGIVSRYKIFLKTFSIALSLSTSSLCSANICLSFWYSWNKKKCSAIIIMPASYEMSCFGQNVT